MWIHAYFIVLEWYWHGQTIGKKAFGIKVVDIQGYPLRFSQVFMRNILRIVDNAPILMMAGSYFLGGIVMLCSRRYQRLGDMGAGTIVIDVNKSAVDYSNSGIKNERYNSLFEFPHLVARLRQETDAREANIAMQALLRAPDLETKASWDLFEELSLHFQEKVKFPDDLIQDLSAEQFIRNIVDVLYSTKVGNQKIAQTLDLDLLEEKV